MFCKRAGLAVASNVPIPGVEKAGGARPDKAHLLLDLGEDEFTVGRPHPMIDPTLRDRMVIDACADANTGVILLDIVIGFGAAANPAGALIAQLPPANARMAVMIASVCGTDADPQSYSRQRQELSDAGIVVAPSNAHAAEIAIALVAAIRAKRP